MSGIWETVKQHKLVVGGIIAAVFVFVLIFSSSSTPAAAPSSGSTDGTDAANAYQEALAQIQGAVQQTQIAAGAQGVQTAAQLEATRINAGTVDNANTLAAQVAEFETSVAGTTQQNHDTLAAQVAENSNATTLGIVNSNNSAIVANTQTVANALVQQSGIQADVAKTISGNQLAAANKPCTSVLFGLFSSC